MVKYILFSEMYPWSQTFTYTLMFLRNSFSFSALQSSCSLNIWMFQIYGKFVCEVKSTTLSYRDQTTTELLKIAAWQANDITRLWIPLGKRRSPVPRQGSLWINSARKYWAITFIIWQRDKRGQKLHRPLCGLPGSKCKCTRLFL